MAAGMLLLPLTAVSYTHLDVYKRQGLFYAPTLVGNALKSAVFAAKLFQGLGFDTMPAYDGKRGDTVQAITLGDAELVKLFCLTIQKYSPVGSYLTPVPSPVPGYKDPAVSYTHLDVYKRQVIETADHDGVYMWVKAEVSAEFLKENYSYTYLDERKDE